MSHTQITDCEEFRLLKRKKRCDGESMARSVPKHTSLSSRNTYHNSSAQMFEFAVRLMEFNEEYLSDSVRRALRLKSSRLHRGRR